MAVIVNGIDRQIDCHDETTTLVITAQYSNQGSSFISLYRNLDY